MKEDAFRKIQALLREIAGNRFQSARLAGLGEITSLDDFTARVPFTTKADLVADQAANPPYGSNLTFPLKRYTYFSRTSGTTAQPLTILDTPESWDWMLGNWERIYREAGIAPGDRLYFAFSFGPFLGFWTAFEGAAKLGCLCIPGGGVSSVVRIGAILQHRAEVLLCTPTYALHLAEVAAREGVSLRDSAVRKIIVAGEPGGSVLSIRTRISAAWNDAEVLDHYGMTEVGPVAFQRLAENDMLHIIEESYFCEIVEPASGERVPDGEVGELVLTPLGRTANPLLRYRTGDLVRRRPGPGFSLAGGIIGRSDDMLVIRGVNIYPIAVDAVVRGIPEITEYRVSVTRHGSLAELAIEIESDNETAARRLENSLGEAFALRIPVSRVANGSLPRFELKARRWQR